MKLSIIDHNLIRVEGAVNSEVYFIMVGDVFFERNPKGFDSVSNNNVNGYQVQIAPVDSIDLVLDITAAHNAEPVAVVVEDRKYQHGLIRFTPQIR